MTVKIAPVPRRIVGFACQEMLSGRLQDRVEVRERNIAGIYGLAVKGKHLRQWFILGVNPVVPERLERVAVQNDRLSLSRRCY